MRIPVTVRRFCDDDVSTLTSLLHRGYKQLADMGLRFVATYQDDATTLERISEGECYLALIDGRFVGTIVFREAGRTRGCAWYDRPDVASFGQFAVEPELHGHGIGSALLEVVESRALESGASEIALDTAEPAQHLIDMYTRKGYRIVERVSWEVTNYRSVVMSKLLSGR